MPPGEPPIPAEQLDAILVGGREAGPITIVAYDPDWPRRFETERARIIAALGSRVLAIEHVGSTSVPGLGAKPIVDICLTVADAEAEEAFAPELIAAGYLLRVVEPGHRMFRTPARDVHLHIYSQGSDEIERYLVFRDYLREHAQARAEYERVKRELASRPWDDMNQYARQKTPVIQAIVSRAQAAARASAPPSADRR